MSETPTAYLYRQAPLDEAGLRALIAEQVFGGGQVYAFSANTRELQSIYSCGQVEDVRLTGDTGDYDFGHVFSQIAELRWKRTDRGYDALLLTENTIPALAEAEIRPERRFTVRTPAHGVAILLDGPHQGRQLDYLEYLAENETVQMQRYIGLR